jgi:hypothetical protein
VVALKIPHKIGEYSAKRETICTDKAFTMLMYPGRTPDDMTIEEALKAAGIHVPTDETDEEHEKGQIAIDI